MPQSMRVREGSDVLGAREDQGRRGREASEHSAEDDHSIQQKSVYRK